jgi:hypothetical protein
LKPSPRPRAGRAERAEARPPHGRAGGRHLSDWEGEFLGSVADRVKTYGRAFGDPEKGAPGEALSVMQTVKLKEIAAKAKGEKKGLARKPFKRRAKPEALCLAPRARTKVGLDPGVLRSADRASGERSGHKAQDDVRMGPR